MNYTRIISYVASTPWAILTDKMEQILAVLAHRAAGYRFTAEEINAQIGDAPPPASSKRGAVAVIPLRGVVAHRMGTMEESSGGMSAERFAQMIRAAAADEAIGSILIDVDSPGGTITGVPEAAQAVFDARSQKRVVAIANGMMASAAYWIASQAHELVALPSIYDRAIGAIGVFSVHQDLSEHLAKEGVKTTIIRAGKYKAETNPFEPLSDEARQEIQASVDAAYNQFIKDVARGRGVTPHQVKGGFGEGRALNAADAKEVSLIDRIAGFDETLGRMVGRKSPGGMRAAEGVEDEALRQLAADDGVVTIDTDDRARRLRLL